MFVARTKDIARTVLACCKKHWQLLGKHQAPVTSRTVLSHGGSATFDGGDVRSVRRCDSLALWNREHRSRVGCEDVVGCAF